MKTLLFLLSICVAFFSYGQSGHWTKGAVDIDNITASNASNKPSYIESGIPKNSGGNTYSFKTELEIQKEIATHQNIEIEELLVENERLKQEIDLLKKEIASFKEEFKALKAELLD